MGSLIRILKDGWNGRWSATSYVAVFILPVASLAAVTTVRNLQALRPAEGCVGDAVVDHAQEIRSRLARGSLQ
jgi:hypothetical protein